MMAQAGERVMSITRPKRLMFELLPEHADERYAWRNLVPLIPI